MSGDETNSWPNFDEYTSHKEDERLGTRLAAHALPFALPFACGIFSVV